MVTALRLAFGRSLRAVGMVPGSVTRWKSAGRLLDRVLHIARDVVQIALRLVDLAFSAKPIIGGLAQTNAATVSFTAPLALSAAPFTCSLFMSIS